MVVGIVVVLIAGFVGAHIFDAIKLPRLLGMLLAGVLIGPFMLNALDTSIINRGEDIRTFALMVVLFKAGLGLDKEKLKSHGTVAIRLGSIPCTIEALVIAAFAYWFLGWHWVIALLLGWVICAESPAILVPLMLALKAKGWGVEKGVPDLILAGGALSDVVAITVFSIILQIAAAGTMDASLMMALPIQIIGGLFIGYLAGHVIIFINRSVYKNAVPVQKLIVALLVTTLTIISGPVFNYSGYLAVMVAGFIVLDRYSVLARQLRVELERVWLVAQIFLFVLIGASVDLSVLANVGQMGILLIGVGLLLGRLPGVFLSTLGSTLTLREKLFLGISYTPKATVQAAIGALPLAMGVANGELILAFAVLAIIFTAPIGAVATSYFAPKLLQQGKIDPTKVTISKNPLYMIAYEPDKGGLCTLLEAADAARQTDARLLVIYVTTDPLKEERAKTSFIRHSVAINDIEHTFMTLSGDPVEQLLAAAKRYKVDCIYMGKAKRSTETEDLGTITKRTLWEAETPVVVVDNE